MRLTFLGTASCFPTPARGVSCTALTLDSGTTWLVDCGEGSQVQLQKSTVKPGRINKIFITHLHGDHLFGLPGLLCTLGNGLDPARARSVTVTVYGPVGLRRFITTCLTLSRSPLAYRLAIVELVPRPDMYPPDWDSWPCQEGLADQEKLPFEDSYTRVECDEKGVWTLLSEGGMLVTAAALVHRIPSFGFIFRESPSPGRLDSDKLLAAGVRPGPIYARLKSGQTAVTEEGLVLDPADYVGPAVPGRKVAVLGDTADSSEVVAQCGGGLDVMVHEATMENSLREKCVEFGHSTPDMAVEVAARAGTRKLVLFHLSPRYRPVGSEAAEGTAQVILDEATEKVRREKIDMEVVVAEDFTQVEIPKKCSG